VNSVYYHLFRNQEKLKPFVLLDKGLLLSNGSTKERTYKEAV
jgi:hypothetical protein